MAGKYAATTKVDVEQSQQELAGVLRRYGAKRIITYNDSESGLHVIQCEIRSRMLRFKVELPPLSDFRLDSSGYLRSERNQQAAWQQEERRRWRVLILTIKAKFEEVESQMTDFDTVFLSNIVLPNNETVAEAMIPKIDEAYASGAMPSLTDTFQRALPPPDDTRRLKEVK